MIHAGPVLVDLCFFQDRIPRRNYNSVLIIFFLGNVCQKCDRITQENVGIDSLKILSFIS